MRISALTMRLMQLSTYLSYFPPYCSGQQVAPLSDNEVKRILYHTMPSSWKKKIVELGYNYLDGYIQITTGFFETRIKNMEKFDSSEESSKSRKTKNNKERKHSN